MLKQIFLILLVGFFAFNSTSQCVPDPIYQDSLPNIWPDSGFPDAIVGVQYSQIWTMKIPSTLIEAALGDTTFVTIDTLGQSLYIGDWTVDSVVTIDVLNTPPGMSVDCNTPNCAFPGGTVACADINGIPTTTDWYNLQIITNLYAHGVVNVVVGGVPLTLPAEINYFDITGQYDTVSRYMITVNEPTDIQNISNNLRITNLVSDNNNISFNIYSNGNTEFNLLFTDLLGRTIISEKIQTQAGKSEYKFSTKTENGIYILNLRNKEFNLSQKIHVSSDK